jgi:hypothetical protein
MYDQYVIVGEEFKNVIRDGKVVGFQIGERLPYYRGVVLSLLGATKLTVDGELIHPEKILLTINGKTLPLTEVENEPVVKWEFGDVGILTVDKPGGLTPGKHKVTLYQHVKTPYIPNGVAATDEKVLTIPS